jgi:hypothetical protein
LPRKCLIPLKLTSASVSIPITGMYAVVVAIDWFIDRCSYRFPARIAIFWSLISEFSPNPCQRQRRPTRQQDHGQVDRHHRRGLCRLRTERAGTARHVQCWRCTAAKSTHAAQPDQGDGLAVDRCRCPMVCSVVCCRRYLLILFVRCNTDIRCFIPKFCIGFFDTSTTSMYSQPQRLQLQSVRRSTYGG